MIIDDFIRSTPRLASAEELDSIAELAVYDYDMEWIRYRSSIMYLYRMYYSFYNGLLTRYSYLPKHKIEKKIRKMAKHCLDSYNIMESKTGRLLISSSLVPKDYQYEVYCRVADTYREIFLTPPHRRKLKI